MRPRPAVYRARVTLGEFDAFHISAGRADRRTGPGMVFAPATHTGDAAVRSTALK